MFTAVVWVGLAFALLLLLSMRHPLRESFQVIETVPRPESVVGMRSAEDEELTTVIDRGCDAGQVGMRPATVEALEATARVNELLVRINSRTSYTFMLVNIRQRQAASRRWWAALPVRPVHGPRCQEILHTPDRSQSDCRPGRYHVRT